MTNEEKKAIDYLIFHKYENSSTKEDMIDKVIELVEKQSKEIEELKIIADDIEGHNIVYTDTPEFEEKYISKDKIKAKIKDKESQINDIKDNLDYNEVMIKEVKRLEDEIEVLQSLLEEE